MALTLTGLIYPVSPAALAIANPRASAFRPTLRPLAQRGSAARISPTGTPPPVTGVVARRTRTATTGARAAATTGARAAATTGARAAAAPDGATATRSGASRSSRSVAISGGTARCAPSSNLTAAARPSASANAQTPSAPDFINSPGTAPAISASGLVVPEVQIG